MNFIHIFLCVYALREGFNSWQTYKTKKQSPEQTMAPVARRQRQSEFQLFINVITVAGTCSSLINLVSTEQ